MGENGTPHLQGFLHFENQIAITTLKIWNPRIHWEPARSIYNSVKYCSDPAKRAPNGRIWHDGYRLPTAIPLSTITEETLRPWQLELYTELKTVPNDRTIRWFYDEYGSAGKTAMARFLITTLRQVAFLSGGRFQDISYQIVKMKEDPKIILINLPRTTEGHVSYAGIESMKDGLIQSGKYEGGIRIYNPPHVVVFANFLPNLGALSLDRWKITYLGGNNNQ